MNKKTWGIVTGAVCAAVLFSFGMAIGYRQGLKHRINQNNIVQEAAGEQGQHRGKAEVVSEQMTESLLESVSETDTDQIKESQPETVTEHGAESVREQATEEVTENTRETEDTGEDTSGEPIASMVSAFLEQRMALGEQWGISIEDLSTHQVYNYGANTQIQSASVIKVFIMGAVYERILYPENEEERIVYTESYEGELRSLIGSMITVSDNDCANRLVEILGEGSYSLGFDVVNAFCRRHGYDQTHMGRRFLESYPTDDNYVSARDCRSILSSIYRRELVSEAASEEMENYLKGQTRKNKIPSGLPEGFTSANKTGEMYVEYGLGSIENDMAIVYSPYGDYTIAVLAGQLEGRNTEAISLIHQISSITANWYIGLHEENSINRTETEREGLIPEA